MTQNNFAKRPDEQPNASPNDRLDQVPHYPAQAGNRTLAHPQFGQEPSVLQPSDAWRFGPPPTHRGKFGVCYLGLDESIPAYVEKYGRFGVITTTQRVQDCLSELTLPSPVAIADPTHSSVLGNFGISALHSTGGDYGPSQKLAAELFDAGFGGIRYRISHDPRLELEAVALFGEPGEHPERLQSTQDHEPDPRLASRNRLRVRHHRDPHRSPSLRRSKWVGFRSLLVGRVGID